MKCFMVRDMNRQKTLYNYIKNRTKGKGINYLNI